MIKSAFTIRPIQFDDIAGVMRLSTEQGWNQTEKDWKLLIEGPQNICLLAECANKIVGTTTAINYSNDVAWIGMVLVDKEYRKQGLSKLLLDEIFNLLKSCKSIKLDATPEGQEVYKKFNFKEEYLITRLINTSMVNLSSEDDDHLLEPIQVKDIIEISAFDKIVFGTNRIQLIESIINEYPNKAWLLNRNNYVSGIVLGREGIKYHQIGPVMASTFIDAKVLISKALKALENKPIVVDVLNDKEDLINWLHSIGFVSQRQFMRMYQNENPFPGVKEKQFLICGPEFG